MEKRAIRWRGLVHWLGPATVWTPPLILAYWGGSYLLGSLRYLLAPGKAIRYVYEGRSGLVEARAEEYWIDLGRRRAILRDVVVREVGGPDRISVSHVSVRQVPNRYEIVVADVRARLTHLANGSFDFESILPKPTGKPSTLKYRVSVNSVDALWRDEFARPTISRHVSASNILVASSGPRVFAAARVRVGSEDPAPVLLHLADDGSFRIRTQADSLDVAPLLPFVRRLLPKDQARQLEPVEARSFVVDGPVWLEHTKIGGTRALAQVQSELAGLKFGREVQAAGGKVTAFFAGDSARIQADLRGPGWNGSFDGSLLLGKHPALGGRSSARLASLSAVPMVARRQLPTGFGFRNLNARGWLAWDDRGWSWNGESSVGLVSVAQQRLENASARIAADPNAVALRNLRATYLGVPAEGAAQIGLKSGAVSGSIVTQNVDWTKVANEFGIYGLSVRARVEAVLSGSTKRPRVDALAKGTGTYDFGQGRKTFLGSLEARVSSDVNNMRLDRLTAVGPNGTYAAQGNVSLAAKTLDISVTGGGLDLGMFQPQVQGLAFVRAHLGGTFHKPLATGRAEVYAIQIANHELPALIVDFSADPGQLLANRIDARLGTGRLSGSAALDLTTKQITGDLSATQISLGTLVSEDMYGVVDLPQISVSGTITEPKVNATIRSEDLLAYGLPLRGLQARVVADKDSAVLTGGHASVDEGDIEIAGEYKFGPQTGNVQADFTDLPLQRAPGQRSDFRLAGTVSGKALAQLGPDGVAAAQLEADLRRLDINGTRIGNGSVTGRLDGREATLEATVGSLERYVRVLDGKYNLDTKDLHADVRVLDLEIPDIVAILRDEIAGLSEQPQRLVRGAKGQLSAKAVVAGNLDAPSALVENLTASNLQIAGRDGGTISASGSFANERYDLQSLLWESGGSTLRATGSLAADKSIQGDADLTNFDLSWVSSVVPNSPNISGLLNLNAVGSGSLDDPTVRASASMSDLALGQEGQTSSKLPLSLDFNRIRFEDDQVVADGLATFQGVGLSVAAQVPLSALQKSASERLPLSLVLRTPEERSLADMAQYAPWLDQKDTAGVVYAEASLSGLIESLQLQANARLDADKLSASSLDTNLRNVHATLTAGNEGGDMQASAESARDGSLQVSAGLTWPDLIANLDQFDRLAESVAIQANATFKDFGVRETLPSAGGPSRARLDGTVKVTGPILEPNVAGEITASNAEISLPTKFGEEATPMEYPVNPTFDDLVLNVAQGTQVRHSAVEIALHGRGVLSGDLSSPDFRMPLQVEKGVFNLPTARVRLEPEGTIDVRYASIAGSQPDMRIDLDLEGNTVVAAKGPGDRYESYEINLRLRGDLASEGGLRIDASSTPGDLSQEQILAILGQRDLIEAIARGATGRSHGSEFESALFSVGLPAFTTGFAQNLAQSLKLDFVSFDYNALNGTMISAGKTIAPGLMLFGRRQVSQNDSKPLLWELELTYRPPLKNRFLSRLRFGIGIDQSTPWKVTVDWSHRF